MWYSSECWSCIGTEDVATDEVEGRNDWLSSLDDGHGDVHGVDEISDDDSSELEQSDDLREIESELFARVRWLNDGREEALLLGSQTY